MCQEQEQSTSQCMGSHSPFRCQNEIQQLPSTFRSSILWVMLVPKFEIWSFAPNLLPSPLPPFLPKTPFGILDLVEVYFKGFDLFNIKSNFQVMSPMAVTGPKRKKKKWKQYFSNSISLQFGTVLQINSDTLRSTARRPPSRDAGPMRQT